MPRGRVCWFLNLVVPLAVLAATPALAQDAGDAQDQGDASINERLDTIIANQRIMMERVAADPLAGHRFGVEINPARLLVYPELHSITGTVSVFPAPLHAEIAFPLFYGRSESGSARLTAVLADAHYRYFLGAVRNGFYISTFARYAHLAGTLAAPGGAGGHGKEDKLGVGFGIGYRIFSKPGPYWGASLSLGRYVVGRGDVFAADDFGDDMDLIADVEMLKVGWAF